MTRIANSSTILGDPTLKGMVEDVEALESPITSSDEQEDSIYCINDLLLQRARTNPNDPFVGYPTSGRGAGDYAYYSPKDLSRFADGAADNMVKQGLPDPVRIEFRTAQIIILIHYRVVSQVLKTRTKLSRSSIHPIWITL